MRASLLIAAHNEGTSLLKTVRSALAAAVGLDCEIVIADDASTDDSIAETMTAFPQIRLAATTRRRGASPAKDLAARHARGDVLLFLDGHTQPEPGSLLRLVEDVEAAEGNAVVTPAVPHLDVRTWTNSRTQVGHGFTVRLDTFACGWTGLSQLKEHRLGRRVLYETPALIGCALAVSRRVYDELRGFDPHMRSWGVEDLDFGLKAWLCGYPLLHDPQAIVGHRFRASFDNYSVPPDHIVVNELRMARKHFTDPHWTEWLERARARHTGNDSPTPALPNPHSPLSRLEHPEGRWANLWTQFLEDRPSVEQERAYLLARRVHDEVWFARRFGLDWPVWPTEKKKSCGCGGGSTTESRFATAFDAAVSGTPSPSPSPMPSPSPSPCPCEVESVSGPSSIWLNQSVEFTISGSCLDDVSVSVTGGQVVDGPSGDDSSQTVTVVFSQLGRQTVTASCNDTSASASISVCAVDVQVDSNNDGTIDETDDAVEEQDPGKVVVYFPPRSTEEETGEADGKPDLVECILGLKTGGASVDQTGWEANLSISGPFTAWMDTERTTPLPTGGTFPLGGDVTLPLTVYLEPVGEGQTSVTLNVANADGAAAADRAQVKAVKHILPKLTGWMRQTFTLNEQASEEYRPLPIANRVAAIRARLIEAAGVADMGLSGLPHLSSVDVYGLNAQAVDFTSVNGFSGFVLAYDAYCVPSEDRYDFSMVKVRFMPFIVIWNNQQTLNGKISIEHPVTGETLLISTAPENTLQHEEWHVDGITSFTNAAAVHGVRLLQTSALATERAGTIKKVGLREGYKRWLQRALKCLEMAKLESVPPTREQTQSKSAAILKGCLVGAIPTAAIVSSGQWHVLAPPVGNTWYYSAAIWHPEDFLGREGCGE